MYKKEAIDKTKRSAIEQEEIVANDMTNKELTSKIYKQLIQPNIKKPKQPITKMSRRYSDDQLIIRDMPIKATMR